MDSEELYEYKKNAPRINCNDYPVGKYKPVSFIPSLNWKIVCSSFIDHPNPNIPRSIIFRGRLGKSVVTVSSSPYSFGKFECECRSIGFFKGYYSLNTHDPEEALYKTEKFIKEWAKGWLDHYKYIYDKI